MSPGNYSINDAAIKIHIRMPDRIPGACRLADDVAGSIGHVDVRPYIACAGSVHPDFVLVRSSAHGPIGHLTGKYRPAAAFQLHVAICWLVAGRSRDDVPVYAVVGVSDDQMNGAG